MTLGCIDAVGVIVVENLVASFVDVGVDVDVVVVGVDVVVVEVAVDFSETEGIRR